MITVIQIIIYEGLDSTIIGIQDQEDSKIEDDQDQNQASTRAATPV